MPLTLDEVRRHIIIAMVSDDELMQVLVLKGGNALAMIHEVGDRASLDMDYSIATQFPDLEETKTRIFRALQREFGSVGYVVFDEDFIPKPSERGPNQPEWWGGYIVEFKLAEKEVFERYKDDMEQLRRNAVVLGPGHRRKYTIDISKNEYCAAKVRKDVDGYAVYVYSLEMIAVEKLRAICQQMPEYTITRTKRPRARDFYDIHEIVRRAEVDLTTPANLQLFAEIFRAKGVPLDLLAKIHEQKNFHEPDWPAVETSLAGTHENFEHYFRFVVDYVLGLEALWKK